MIIGACTLEFHLPGCRSLKSKRSLLRRLQSRLRSHYNVAVCEVGYQDLWQRATLGVAAVASDRSPLDKLFARITGELERHPEAQLVRVDTEFF